MERVNSSITDLNDCSCFYHLQGVNNCYGQSGLISPLELYLFAEGFSQSKLFSDLQNLKDDVKVSLSILDLVYSYSWQVVTSIDFLSIIWNLSFPLSLALPLFSRPPFSPFQRFRLLFCRVASFSLRWLFLILYFFNQREV